MSEDREVQLRNIAAQLYRLRDETLILTGRSLTEVFPWIQGSTPGLPPLIVVSGLEGFDVVVTDAEQGRVVFVAREGGEGEG